MNTVKLERQEMILYLLNFIRYDIPILMAGKSSIGKSYTVLSMAKQWGMPNSVLYVGSEKADNIEGLPKLIQSEKETLTSENVLEYYKPYWFPKSNLIQEYVKRGQEIFDTKIKPYFKYEESNTLPYETIMGLLFAIRKMSFIGNETTQTFYCKKFDEKKDSKSSQYNRFVDTSGFINHIDRFGNNIEQMEFLTQDVVLTRELLNKGEDMLTKSNQLYELSLYLCTLVGLGNYWLVLDELDKVQPEEADKFAPMLHIVRERRLKNYSLRELNDGKGADVGMNVVGNSYLKIYNQIKESLRNNQSVLDTRIIAVSNKTDNIIEISDALFKRFVQVVIGEILVLDPVEEKLNDIRTCLSNLETKLEGSQGALSVGYLEEINLQWTFGFLPRILNTGDSAGNFFRNDYINKTASALTITDDDLRLRRLSLLKENTALFKLCLDNFSSEERINIKADNEEPEYSTAPKLVMDCLVAQVQPMQFDEVKEVKNDPLDLINDIKKKGFDDRDTAFEVYDLLMNKYSLINKDENRSFEIQGLIDYAFSFISNTAYSDGYSEQKIQKKEPYTPLEINKYLIPLITKFILKVATKDDSISYDDKDRLMSFNSELWNKFVIPEYIDMIKGDEELTHKLFYVGEDSLWGSTDLNADDFQKSFVNTYNTSNFEVFAEFLRAYVGTEWDEDGKKEFDEYIEYIKKYRKDDVISVRDMIVNEFRVNKKAIEMSQTRKKFNEIFDLQ